MTFFFSLTFAGTNNKFSLTGRNLPQGFPKINLPERHIILFRNSEFSAFRNLLCFQTLTGDVSGIVFIFLRKIRLYQIIKKLSFRINRHMRSSHR